MIYHRSGKMVLLSRPLMAVGSGKSPFSMRCWKLDIVQLTRLFCLFSLLSERRRIYLTSPYTIYYSSIHSHPSVFYKYQSAIRRGSHKCIFQLSFLNIHAHIHSPSVKRSKSQCNLASTSRSKSSTAVGMATNRVQLEPGTTEIAGSRGIALA